MKRIFAPLALLTLLLLAAGCAPKITSLQRKEAASLVSEAQFASTLREWRRAEELTAKAAALCPDNGEYWLNLGSFRRRLDNLSGARAAYTSAAKAYGAAYQADPKDPQPLMQQVYVYSLLGKPKDALKALKRAQADHGGNPGVKNFTEQALERLCEDPEFKALAV
jgi:tetratricopeptide (TPR) repeat protein